MNCSLGAALEVEGSIERGSELVLKYVAREDPDIRDLELERPFGREEVGDTHVNQGAGAVLDPLAFGFLALAREDADIRADAETDEGLPGAFAKEGLQNDVER